MELAGLHIGQLVLNGYQRVVDADSQFDRLLCPARQCSTREEPVPDPDLS